MIVDGGVFSVISLLILLCSIILFLFTLLRNSCSNRT